MILESTISWLVVAAKRETRYSTTPSIQESQFGGMLDDRVFDDTHTFAWVGRGSNLTEIAECVPVCEAPSETRDHDHDAHYYAFRTEHKEPIYPSIYPSAFHLHLCGIIVQTRV